VEEKTKRSEESGFRQRAGKKNKMAALSTTLPLTRDSVFWAHKVVKNHVHRTPVVTNQTLSELASTPRTVEELATTRFAGDTPAKPVLRLWFKCENLQRIGAFKVRGAFYALHKLAEEPGWLEGGGKEKGVVTHSSGKKIFYCLHYITPWPLS
jgi:threonine dehydratase